MRYGLKRLFSLVFFSAFLALAVSAQSVCLDSDDTILKLSARSNSHGEFYSYSNYNYEICYSDLFGDSTPVTNPHDCRSSPGNDPANLVLRLSDFTNAHAQTPDYTGTAYTIDVCYRDLTCYSTSGSCASNEREIVSLSADNNAHLETANANNYNLKICCMANVARNKLIFAPKWRYYNGVEIPENSLICPNSYLIASVQTRGLDDGQTVSFDVRDSRLVSRSITVLSGFVINNQANVTINLNNPNTRDLFNGFLSSSRDFLNLYFRASNPSVSTAVPDSGIVKYTSNSNLCSYEKPVVRVNAPTHRGVYFKGTTVNFESGCTSQIGPLQYDWTITQGDNTYRSTLETFTLELGRQFGDSGQANVKLKCTDLRGNSGIAENEILIAEANSPILAYINEPAFNSFVYTSPLLNRPYFPQTVGFSGQDSFAISVNGCTVTCLGGDCPEKTENSLSNCGATPPGGPIDITQTTGGVTYNTLNYDWKFWDNDWENLWTSYEGDGIYRGVVVYDDVSNQINDKHMSVLITLEDGVTSAQFSRDFTLGRCLNNGNTYYDPSLGALSTSEENNACKGGDLNSGTADDCCPSGLVCSTDGSLSRNHYCKLSDRIINRCEDFEDKDSCESNTNPAIPRASYGQNPPICTFLECFWSSNSCGVRATRYTQDPNGCVIGGGGRQPNICEWTTTQTECINGRKTIHYTKVSGDDTCNKEDVEVPCGSLNFELGFFGIREFVISLLLITGIYLLFGICGKKRNEKK